ncbi:hypothetical protein [Clostridium botulinum]|uniref:hypothetical protein n=1 Tax=Clostridium botulinum TaxID=1491 RepID=UPI000466911C|nr:hypothetical protein [Clostridium botulinum]APR02501.1 hypothetical protein RSJ2_4170 [Clostridium botulinum]MBN3351999.1 hypothetical protein [Clostridium botulinum]
MANYKKFENQENVYVEQNIYNNKEIESYESKLNLNGTEKTVVLYYYEDDNKRFYSLGTLENLVLNTISIIKNDLSDIFKFKTANTRRKYIYKIICENESTLICL